MISKFSPSLTVFERWWFDQPGLVFGNKFV